MGMLSKASRGAKVSSTSMRSMRRQIVPRVKVSRACQAKAAGSRKTPTLTQISACGAQGSGSHSWA